MWNQLQQMILVFYKCSTCRQCNMYYNLKIVSYVASVCYHDVRARKGSRIMESEFSTTPKLLGEPNGVEQSWLVCELNTSKFWVTSSKTKSWTCVTLYLDTKIWSKQSCWVIWKHTFIIEYELSATLCSNSSKKLYFSNRYTYISLYIQDLNSLLSYREKSHSELSLKKEFSSSWLHLKPSNYFVVTRGTIVQSYILKNI